MSAVIRQETMIFLTAVCHGIIWTWVYDLLRAFRIAFSHNTAAVSAEDFLFWITAGFFTFCLTFFQTDGVIRGYVVLGIGLGAILYHYSVSRWMMRMVSEALKYLKNLMLFFWEILISPVKKTGRIYKKVIEFAWKSGYNLSAGNKCATKEKKRGSNYGKKKKASK